MPRKGLSMDEIIAAATALVEEKGLDNFSLRELAARLGIKPASLYNHAANVDALTTAVGHIALNALYEQLHAVPSDLDRKQRLLLNRFAGGYGDAAIASFSVVTKIMNISSAAILGFGQGFQPVCGFNYGVGRIDRVKKAFWFSVKISTVALILICIPLGIFAPQLVRIFRDDPEVIRLGTKILRCQIISMPFLGWVIVANMFLQNIRKVVPACIVAMSRQGLVFLPLVFVLTHLWGLTGLALTQLLSDIVTFLISLPLALKALQGLHRDLAGQTAAET